DNIVRDPLRRAGPDSAETRSERQARILRFWRSVEYFSAQTVKPPDAEVQQVKNADESERRYDVAPAGPTPWEPGHELRLVDLDPDKVWRYTLYGGVFSLDRLYRTLADAFGEDGRDVDERTPRGDSALFAVAVSPGGRLLLDTFTISQAGWALGRTLSPGPASADWLEGFDEAVKGILTRVAARIQVWDDTQARVLRGRGLPIPQGGLPVAAGLVHELVGMIADALGVEGVLTPHAVRAQADPVDIRYADQQQDTDFLNSFVAEDLDRVAGSAAGGGVGATLDAYLTDQPDPSARFDVRAATNLDSVLDLLAPANIPAGRWPADPEHSLVTSQQLAVNQIRARLCDEAGLFGVNGPPGTGKTTMLRDLVAATVVDRARQLAALASPRDGFIAGSWTGWDIGSKPIRFPRLVPELTGFEILVASSNNGAVENVTRELPDRQNIADPWREADYLREHATRLLRAAYKGPINTAPEAWGLLAATLGN
ncbi:DEAD/DEAH box helicase family protein, partial [Promicromonospora xylanilytica]